MPEVKDDFPPMEDERLVVNVALSRRDADCIRLEIETTFRECSSHSEEVKLTAESQALVLRPLGIENEMNDTQVDSLTAKLMVELLDNVDVKHMDQVCETRVWALEWAAENQRVVQTMG